MPPESPPQNQCPSFSGPSWLETLDGQVVSVQVEGLIGGSLGRDAPGKSMVPLLSASTSLIMSWSSDSEGFWPRERMTVPSSLVVI